LLAELSLHRRQQLTRSYSEKQRYDGWYNNLAHPQWGTVGKTPYLISPNLISPNFNSPNLMSPDLISPSLISPNLNSPSLISPDLISPGLISPRSR
jgi:hypothetical protein